MINVGKYKVIFDRLRGYFQTINSVILIYLLINETGFKVYYLLTIPVMLLLAYYDNKKIIAQERDYIWTRPGELKDLIDNVKLIKKTLDTNYKKH